MRRTIDPASYGYLVVLEASTADGSPEEVIDRVRRLHSAHAQLIATSPDWNDWRESSVVLFAYMCGSLTGRAAQRSAA